MLPKDRFLNRVAGGVRALVRRKAAETELDEELAEFLQASIDAKLAAGMSPEDARRAARLELGSPAAVKDWVRDVGWESRVESIWQDVRYAGRVLRRSPGFAFAAILTFALGIGANTAIFSIVDAAILRPLPYEEPHRLVTFRLHNPKTGRATDGFMPRDFLDWRDRSDLFENIALIGGGAFTLRGAIEPEELRVSRVTAGFFEMFRISPLLGRFFTRDDERPGDERVVIVSHVFWQSHLGGSADVIGSTLHLNDRPYEIVGVLPERFTYPANARLGTRVFLPFTFTAKDHERGVVQSSAYGPTARLRDGVTIVKAEAALAQMLAAADVHKKAFNKGYLRAEVTPLIESYVGAARSWMLMLLGAVSLVLLIACANVAHLVLAHGTTRVRELTLRGALGASRSRIARQLIAESLVLSTLGAIAGIAVAWWGLGALRASMPTSIPRAASIALDLRVLGFTGFVSIATGLICGLLPALQGSRVDLVRGLKDSGHGATGGRLPQRIRYTLAWAEIALAVMLLVGAGLFISSFVRLMRVDHGFDASGITVLSYSVPRTPEDQPEDPELLRRMLAAVRAVPGVEASLIVAGNGPYFGGSSSVPLRIAGRAATPGEDIRWKNVSTGFLEMLHVPVKRGRLFTEHDTRHAAPAAVVNEAAVQQFWERRNPIGDRLEINRISYEIVGIVGDMRYAGPAARPVPEVFVHYEQTGRIAGGDLLIRSRLDLEQILPAVKAAIWSENPGQPIASVRTAEELLGRTMAARRFNMTLMTIFAGLALLIAATGIYGVIAFIVGHRTREIGVRMALGAQAGQVVRLFLRQGSAVLAGGIGAGLVGAWVLARTVEAFLFEVEPRDSVVFISVALLLGVVGLTACWIPARRAAAVDPLTALRAD